MEKIQPFDTSVLNGVDVRDENNQPVDLGTIFASSNGRGILIFRRHFNCFVCSFQLHQIIKAGPQLAQEGYPVVIVAPEGPSGIKPYRQRYSIADEVRILADPKKEAYTRLQFSRQKNLLHSMIFDRPTYHRIMDGLSKARENGFTEWGSSINAVFADVQQQGGILLPHTNSGEACLYKQGIFEEEYPKLEEIRAQLEDIRPS